MPFCHYALPPLAQSSNFAAPMVDGLGMNGGHRPHPHSDFFAVGLAIHCGGDGEMSTPFRAVEAETLAARSFQGQLCGTKAVVDGQLGLFTACAVPCQLHHVAFGHGPVVRLECHSLFVHVCRGWLMFLTPVFSIPVPKGGACQGTNWLPTMRCM